MMLLSLPCHRCYHRLYLHLFLIVFIIVIQLLARLHSRKCGIKLSSVQMSAMAVTYPASAAAPRVANGNETRRCRR